MVERMVKATVSGWRPWALGAALSMGCAAFMLFRRRRSASRTALDAYEEWWQHREHVRANGDEPPRSDSSRPGSPQLFV